MEFGGGEIDADEGAADAFTGLAVVEVAEVGGLVNALVEEIE